jgi:hypothetical protein
LSEETLGEGPRPGPISSHMPVSVARSEALGRTSFSSGSHAR